MASSVSGKVAFVTGGASGIGAALATKLVDGGAEVWIADRQMGPAQDLAQRLNRGGTKAHAIELDVRSYPSFERAVAEAVGQSGRIDYLFNNAGILVEGEVDSYTLDDWNDVFRREPARCGARHPGGLSDHDRAALRPYREHSLDCRSRRRRSAGQLLRH